MSDQAHALADQFEQANTEAIGVVEDCPEEQWQAHHPGENRTVNVLAHHIAVGHQIIAAWVQGMATGQPLPALTMDSFTEPNARHAQQYAQVTKAEVLAALQQQGAAAARLVRGLSDEQLERAGELLGRQWRTRDVIEHVLIGHVRNHLGSIHQALAPAGPSAAR
jgi:uncharacterized damage-inducible protein DinB